MTNDNPDHDMKTKTPGLLVRHESDARKEKSTCGWRYRLVSEGDEDGMALAHAVDIDGSKAHYHKLGTGDISKPN